MLHLNSIIFASLQKSTQSYHNINPETNNSSVNKPILYNTKYTKYRQLMTPALSVRNHNKE